MSLPIDALPDAVLNLPTDAPAKLLDRVVASLDADRKRDEAWDAIAASRDAEIESGAVTVTSSREVLTRLRNDLDGIARLTACGVAGADFLNTPTFRIVARHATVLSYRSARNAGPRMTRPPDDWQTRRHGTLTPREAIRHEHQRT